jgi:hypothetical protein
MSAKASFGCPAPLDVEFSVVKELAQYVVRTKAGHAWRIHAHNDETGLPFDPVFFSEQEGSRWDFKSDSKLPYSGGVLCIGKSFEAAVLESFSKNWPSVLTAKPAGAKPYEIARVLTADDLTRKYATRLGVPAGLRLFDLTATGAMSSVGHGLDAWVTATKAYDLTRTWSRWFFQCRDIDGLIYSSRPGGAKTINYVLFSRPGLKESLEANAGPTRRLGKWSRQIRRASKVLNFAILAPLPPPRRGE